MKKKKILFPEIAAEMARNGETLKDLAELLGLKIGSVSQKLNGRVRFYETEVRQLCYHYNRDYFDLFKRGE